METYNFQRISWVPAPDRFMDMMLPRSSHWAKLPVIHPRSPIPRIRAFYMRKVKFANKSCHNMITQFVNSFPCLDDVHPLYAGLIDALFDRGQYKVALGVAIAVRSMVDTVAKAYVRLIKCSDTLIRCKQLNRAALGRVCALIEQHKAELVFLQQARDHLRSLPLFDPDTPTLLVTGFPDAGKSTFVNRMTLGNTYAQSYPFTTEELYLGHVNHDYQEVQVMNTPGMLDQPLDQRGAVPMQALAAFAHLPASVLVFLDITEQCGYTIELQLSLLPAIRSLFAGKPLLLVCTKIDIMPYESLAAHHRQAIEAAAAAAEAKIFTVNNNSDASVGGVKAQACNQAVQQRKVIHDPFKSVTNEKTYGDGGAGHAEGELNLTEWPDIGDDDSLADFVNAHILAQLDEIDREEEALDVEAADSQPLNDDDIVSDLDDDDKATLRAIRDKSKHAT